MAGDDEAWQPLMGGGMVGTCRAIEKGGVGFYELLAIEPTVGAAMKIRHFGAGLIAWEEKDSPLSFRLEHARGAWLASRLRPFRPSA